MPITGTHVALASARKSAAETVKAKYLALDRKLTAAEMDALQRELLEADSSAIIAHLVANTTVVVTTPAPGAGTIT